MADPKGHGGGHGGGAVEKAWPVLSVVAAAAILIIGFWTAVSWLSNTGPWDPRVNRPTYTQQRNPASSGDRHIVRGKPGDPGCQRLPNGVLRCPNHFR